jgi:membrane-associated phospholipid phosphatase/tRNA A-37 threonylcarbamoyl transferase component Bud32
MENPPDTSLGTAQDAARTVGPGPAKVSAPPGTRRVRRRRRPTGEPPPLPRHLESTGVGWLIAAVGLVILTLLVFTVGRYGRGVSFAVVDYWLLERLASLRVPWLTTLMEGLAGALGALLIVKLLAWSTLIALIVFKRFRHLFVGLVAFQVVSLLVLLLSATVRRPRPFGIPIEGSWTGWSMPSRPVAYLSAILVTILYTLVPRGRWRQTGKWVATALVTVLAAARMYLGVDTLSDVLVGAAIGVTIPLLAFRWFTPNEVFPVRYRRGRTAHLDVTGARGQGIRQALQDQLGLVVEEITPFGLAGSASSTPLRIKVAGDPETILFGKLYALSHLRADRWYKLGRELRYGRLEDEKAFNSVRRLVEREDYALGLMRRAGLPVPESYGTVELTPEREYLLVTEFLKGSREIGEVAIDDDLIDQCLSIIRRLWDADLAHRDIKPANLLVQDGAVRLIDVFLTEVHPTPWRQAIDLANMMLFLGLRTDAARVYHRARQFFTDAEIGEAFAAVRGPAMPAQLRHMLRGRPSDLKVEFLDLLPTRPHPISIQRWSLKRIIVALLAVAVMAVVVPLLVGWGTQTETANASLLTSDIGCGDREALWLMAQAVPSATLVPCLQVAPPGWSLNDVKAASGFASIVFDTDRPYRRAAVTLELRPSCDLAGATEVSSELAGTRRYIRIDRGAAPIAVIRTYVFPGGCVSQRFVVPISSSSGWENISRSAFGFVTRAALGQELAKRSDGRLRLDPGIP